MCNFVMFDIIHHARKSLLFNIQQTWIKRDSRLFSGSDDKSRLQPQVKITETGPEKRQITT